MPLIECKQEGAGNGLKTILVNLDLIARSIDRSAFVRTGKKKLSLKCKACGGLSTVVESRLTSAILTGISVKIPIVEKESGMGFTPVLTLDSLGM